MLEFLMLSNWESWFALVFVVVMFAVLIFLKQRKKISNFKILILASIMGVVGFGIFEILTTQIPTEVMTSSSWEFEVFNWLKLTPDIFILLVVMIIPILMFVSFINLFINSKIESRKRFILINGLTILSILIGMGLGFALLPALKSIDIADVAVVNDPSDDSLIGLINGWIPSTLSIFLSPIFLISIGVFSIIITAVLFRVKKTNNKTFEATSNFFKHLNNIVFTYLGFVFLMLPFVVLTSLSMLGVGNFFELNITDYLIFLGIIIGVALLIYGLNILIVFGFSKFITNSKPNYKTLLFGSKGELQNYLNDKISDDQLRETRTFFNEANNNHYNNFVIWTKGAPLIFNGGFLPIVIVLISAQNSNMTLDYTFYISLIIVNLFVSFSLRSTNNHESTVSISTLQSVQAPFTGLYVFLLPLQLILKPLNYFVNNSSTLMTIYSAEALTHTWIYNRNVYEIQEVNDTDSNQLSPKEEMGIDIVEDKTLVDTIIDQLNNSDGTNDFYGNVNIVEENVEDFTEQIREELEKELNDLESTDEKERNVW